ncbi:uncharacterized protein LOC110177901 [Drosophila serrata]|uniref:uncharacterized protein LOC110177901 n=1 Tax=Drosophila serrata TaxID=7274 RepID=UPI000A1CFE7A|nr:uncharacterized protein LOC110177901 [Drosophila serrata]
MFWSILAKAFTSRQSISKSGSQPSGKPPGKPQDKPPGKPPGPPTGKDQCKTRTECQPAQFCAETDRFHSMWEPPKNLPPPYPFVVRRSNELCCEPNCTKPLPSFDELYYHPSCKKGPFQRTWVECPEFMVRKKVICRFDKLEALEPSRRLAKKRERVTQPPKDMATGPCPHLAPLARCIPGRRPPRCRKDKTPACCRKLCAPVPCWSECKQPPLARLRPRSSECECKRPITPCEVERGRQYMKIHGPNYVCPKDVRKAMKESLKMKVNKKFKKNKKKKNKVKIGKDKKK